jgi:hypothetical protein
MAAIANIVLNDAATTPVAHTFSPARQGFFNGQDIAEYEDRVVNGGIPVGFYRVNLALSRPSKDRKSYRIGLKLSTPVLEVVNSSTYSGITPAPTISYTPLAQVDVVIPDRASLQSRKDIRKMLYEALNSATVVNAIENLDFPY